MESFPRALIRRVENANLPLMSLRAIRDLRRYLDGVEAEAMTTALSLGANAEDIAEALGMTPQGVRYRLKQLEDSRVRS